jgi:cytochrome P450 family 142 subfamily A polypeptide 1
VTDTAAPPIDLLSPAFYGDPEAMHAAFRWLRAHDPVHRDEANGLWGVTRHADVMDVERRAEVFSSATGYRSHHEPDEDNMIAQDDPGHLDQRRLVNRRFTPRAVGAMEGYLTDLVDDVLVGALDGGSMEVVSELAAPVPARLTAHLLGFAEERWPEIQSWSERLMRYDEVDTDEAKMLDFVAAIMEFVPVLMETAAARRAEPGDDLVTDWVQGEAKGCPMSDSKLVNECGLVISGGAETTRTVISRGLVAFAEHPDQWEAMAADPSLVPGAVEELIRWVTPLNNFFRTVTRDDHIGDQPVRAGDRVAILYPSANRDEAVFDRPDTFDITRDPNPHVAFGRGTHFCLGANLARVELRILFERLSQRITDLRVTRGPVLEENIFVTAVQSLEMSFRPR